MAAALIEFGQVMAEVGRTHSTTQVVNKTYNSINEIFKNISSSQTQEVPQKEEETIPDNDDEFFSNENFLAAVAELEKAITKTSKYTDHDAPSFSLGLTPPAQQQKNDEEIMQEKTNQDPADHQHQNPDIILNEYAP